MFGVLCAENAESVEHEHVAVKMCEVFRPNNDDSFYGPVIRTTFFFILSRNIVTL